MKCPALFWMKYQIYHWFCGFFLCDKRVHAIKPQNPNRSVKHPAEERLSVWWGSKHTTISTTSCKFPVSQEWALAEEQSPHLCSLSKPCPVPSPCLLWAVNAIPVGSVSDGPDQNTPWQNNSPMLSPLLPWLLHPHNKSWLGWRYQLKTGDKFIPWYQIYFYSAGQDLGKIPFYSLKTRFSKCKEALSHQCFKARTEDLQNCSIREVRFGVPGIWGLTYM